MTRTPIEEEVLASIKPLRAEHNHVWEVAEKLLFDIDASGIATGMVVGSVARDTWVRGDRDLDIFMLFPPSLPREELESKGLALARAIGRKYHASMREKYAEHPYINLSINGLDIDLVPCYAVETASGIQSAVDRTPFHTRYIRERIRQLSDDVLLLKQFAKTGGVYGSDQMTEGFAGYLCELLILHYHGFSGVLRAAAEWRPHTLIDIEGHAAKHFDEPLVVIDPVDPARNVAASLSLSRMFEFVELCRGYLDAPSPAFFRPGPPESLGREEFAGLLTGRRTAVYAITFATPHTIPDIVVPQLRKSLDAIEGMLLRYGFVVNRTDCAMEERHCMLLFEMLVDVLPPLKRHMGPPLWNRANAEKFFLAYPEGTYSGPYIEDGRYWVEIPRKHTRVDELLASESPLKIALGRHVKMAMQEGWTLHSGTDCWSEEFAPFLAAFLARESPLRRILRRTEGS
ncbi:MAG: CCA tRNA nucleotidyltransferase [Methanomicrobiales archaeon]|nr:CCA tRNA nucleotidyltransferase [Methanomicrobiales archaeon]